MDCISTSKNSEVRFVNYVCPECKKIGSLKTPIGSLKNSGLSLISVSKGTICPHSFLAEIGRDFTQRSSYVPDFTLEIQNEDKTPRISRRIRLNVLSTIFRRILIKKACTLINSTVKLGFAIAVRITRRNKDL